MADDTAEFFEELARIGHEPRLEKVKGTVRFDLLDDGRVERWYLAVDKGDLDVSRRNAKADCIVRTQKALFDELASGRANAMTAVLRGVVAVEGEFELLALFQRLLPGPPGSREVVNAGGAS
jgi:ubiquinone biosynthesis protein UbiJ